MMGHTLGCFFDCLFWQVGSGHYHALQAFYPSYKVYTAEIYLSFDLYLANIRGVIFLYPVSWSARACQCQCQCQ